MGGYRIVEVDKLALSSSGLVSAYSAGLMLQEKGWTLYPASSWDKPAILAFDGEKCAAGINWHRDDDDGHVNVQFAWCSPDHPRALALCLLRLRKRLHEEPPSWLSFTCHVGNSPMEKLVAKLQLRAHSHSYRVPQSYYQREIIRTQPKPQSRLLAMLRAALDKLDGTQAGR